MQVHSTFKKKSAATATARMVNLRPPLQKVRDLHNRGRHLPDDRIQYNEVTRLALKNRVTPQTESKRKVCMPELMDVLMCMGKFDQNQAMCGDEIKK